LREYDVAVIGAGPAGSACAWKLSRSGVRTVLVDRAVIPRGKVCGGALSGSATKILLGCGILGRGALDSLTLREHLSMSCFDGLRPLRTWASGGPPVLLVERKSLDDALLSRAREAGAEVVEGDGFAGIEGAEVRLRSGEGLRCGKVVGADGVHSAVAAAAFGRKPSRRGFGLEFFLPAPPGLEPVIQIHFGLRPYGYGWVFPRSDDVCVGIGCCDGDSSPADLVPRLLALTEATGFGRPPLSLLRGAPIPSGRPSASLGAGDVYLAGDAAGLVDRISGEGIGLALESGLLVADAIAGGWTRQRLRRAFSEGCGGRVRRSAFARHLLYHPLLQGMAMSRLARKDKFYEGYWKLISGEIGYREMLKGFLSSP
jgi:geranylgeranyl reductase family protein